MSSIADNLTKVRQQLASAAKEAGRDEHEVTLLAVSKTRLPEEIETAYAQGQRHFGENYLQESLDKIEQLAALDIIWHFIGPIQSNKTRPIAENFAWVHTIERLKIAQRLSDQRPEGMPNLNVCLQVNISREDSKSGCLPEDVPLLAEQIQSLNNITLRGLMAIPKATDDPNEQHQAFKAMQDLFTALKPQHPSLDTLSMGMSGDMEVAIAEGATIVRIGTAIFGPRLSKQ